MSTWVEVRQNDTANWITTHIPAWVRHPVAIFIGTYAAIVLGAIVSAKGITTVPDWGNVFKDGLDTGAAAAAGGLVALFALPLTDAYGVGKKTEIGSEPRPEVDPEDAQDEEDEIYVDPEDPLAPPLDTEVPLIPDTKQNEEA